MRRSWWIAVGIAAALAGCHGEEVAPPDLQRPVEALPAGAHAVLLASDLRNTWQRVEAHDLRTVLENWPGTSKVMCDSGVVRFVAACREFEAKTGTRLLEDLVLNLIGDRAGLAMYRRAGAGNEEGGARSFDAGENQDLLLVADLQDGARFRAACAALAAGAVPQGPVVREELFDGLPGWRLDGPDSRSFRVVQQDNFVAVGTNDELLRQALALHAGTGGASALRDSVVQTALRAIGAHNVVGVVSLEAGAWSANGFTWDSSGLHFDQTASTAHVEPHAPASVAGVWASIPDGMTFAACVRHRDLNLQELGKHLRLGAKADARGARSAGAGGMPMLPDLSRPWVGDAFGVALRGVEPTSLAPIPDLAFIVQVLDATAADADLRGLEGGLRGIPLGGVSRGFEDVRYSGRTYRSLVQPLSETVSPSWIVDGDVAIIATTRTLMQQILDTRRTGRRGIRSDAAFTRFKTFVPEDAAAVFYANQTRLHRVAAQLDKSSSLWGPEVEQSIDFVERLSGVLEHFPAGAAYVTRAGDSVTLRGWMAEAK